MSDALPDATATTMPRTLFVRGPVFDVVMAWGWLPFFIWLCTTDLLTAPATKAYRAAFATAMVAVLSVNFIHRHFVYLLFFGDRQRREQHRLATWAAPLAAIALATAAAFVPVVATAAAVILGSWNVWHTLMQRHGLARAYAVSLSPVLATQQHGRSELAVLWAATVTTAIAVMRFQTATFFGPARRVWETLPLSIRREPRIFTALLVVSAAVTAVLVWRWWRHERQAPVPAVWRWPRTSLLASTGALLLVFVVAGPIVGYIVFGFAHAVEYILFAHAFSRRQASRGPIARGPGLLAAPLGLTIVSAVLLATFALAWPVWNTRLFIFYFTTTSLLHYIYDGLIWRRKR